MSRRRHERAPAARLYAEQRIRPLDLQGLGTPPAPSSAVPRNHINGLSDLIYAAHPRACLDKRFRYEAAIPHEGPAEAVVESLAPVNLAMLDARAHGPLALAVPRGSGHERGLPDVAPAEILLAAARAERVVQAAPLADWTEAGLVGLVPLDGHDVLARDDLALGVAPAAVQEVPVVHREIVVGKARLHRALEAHLLDEGALDAVRSLAAAHSLFCASHSSVFVGSGAMGPITSWITASMIAGGGDLPADRRS